MCALNDVITTHWVMTQGNATLPIYGPPGTAQFVERQMAALEADIGYRIEHHEALTVGPKFEVTEHDPGDSFTVNDVRISTAATEHSPARPTVGFRLEHDGAVAALVGDTVPCAGVDLLAAAADAYVQTVIRRDLVEAIPNELIQDILAASSVCGREVDGQFEAQRGSGLSQGRECGAGAAGFEAGHRCLAGGHSYSQLALADSGCLAGFADLLADFDGQVGRGERFVEFGSLSAGHGVDAPVAKFFDSSATH